MDTSLDADARANLLLDASSLEQTMRWLNEWGANRPTETQFGDVTYPEQVPCTPDVVYANGAEGVHGEEGTTAWPAPIGIAATWDLDRAETRGSMIANEAWQMGNAVILGPGLVSGRLPVLGRSAEYFGESPLLGGRMAAATVRGMEDGEGHRIVSNPKHYVANEQELDRDFSSSNMDDRTLMEVYDLPYRIAIEESDPASIMCSYNQINGIPACENPILDRNMELAGFRGYVVSDFGSVHSTADSLNNGLDQELNRPVWFTPDLLNEALEAGEITEDGIRDAAFRVVRAYIEQGLFDDPVPEEPSGPVKTEESVALAEDLAIDSMVLLRNEGVLPFGEDVRSIGLIGPTAAIGTGESLNAEDGCAAYLIFRDAPVLDCSALVDPLTAFAQRAAQSGAAVSYADGSDMEAVRQVAANSDAVIVFGHKIVGETFDADSLALDNDGDALVAAAAEESDNVVVAIQSGIPVAMPWLDDVEGVVMTWYAGERTGPALAALAFGDENFAGRLSITFPQSLEQSPVGGDEARYPGTFADGSTERAEGDEETIRQVDYSEGLAVGHAWYEAEGVEPLFWFGHGLSYTDFAYSGLTVEAGEGGTATVTFTVENTGERDGTAIPQLYLAYPDAAEVPGSRLVGFDRRELAAGESAEVTIELSSDAGARPFSVWSPEATAWELVPGDYTLRLAQSAGETAEEATLTIPE